LASLQLKSVHIDEANVQLIISRRAVLKNPAPRSFGIDRHAPERLRWQEGPSRATRLAPERTIDRFEGGKKA
jgi:hypothetical protein